MDWKLFLDDIRNPPDDSWTIARSSWEAIKLTQENGLPIMISFDHDLGEEDSAMDYIRWISQAWYDSSVPAYQVHSANPVGRDNIISKMNSWKKSQSL